MFLEKRLFLFFFIYKAPVWENRFKSTGLAPAPDKIQTLPMYLKQADFWKLFLWSFAKFIKNF